MVVIFLKNLLMLDGYGREYSFKRMTKYSMPDPLAISFVKEGYAIRFYDRQETYLPEAQKSPIQPFTEKRCIICNAEDAFITFAFELTKPYCVDCARKEQDKREALKSTETQP